MISVGPGSSTLSFFLDDFQLPDPKQFNDKMKINSFSNSGDEFETERVKELMSMSDNPARFTDLVREDHHGVSYADDFPDVVETLAEEETDEKNTNEETDNGSESSDDNFNRPLYPGCCLSPRGSNVVLFCAEVLTLLQIKCLFRNMLQFSATYMDTHIVFILVKL